MEPLSTDFFDRPTLDVARDLLGCFLVLDNGEGRCVGRVVETEGYTQDDPAFHGWGIVDRQTGLIKPDGRGYDLFARPGTSYVYLIYGMYWLLNVVTEREGVGGAVLIRALEPVSGIDRMYEGRPAARTDRDLTSGPGKLTQAFGIDKRHHGIMLTEEPLFFARDAKAEPCSVSTSCRIGITRGIDLPWRFFIEDNPYVSPGIPSDIAAERRRRYQSTRRL